MNTAKHLNKYMVSLKNVSESNINTFVYALNQCEADKRAVAKTLLYIENLNVIKL